MMVIPRTLEHLDQEVVYFDQSNELEVNWPLLQWCVPTTYRSKRTYS